MKNPNDYLIATEFKLIIGKKAIIKNGLTNYGRFLWNKTGIIQEVNGWLSLKFDSPAVRYEGDHSPMNSVYLTADSFQLI